MSIWARRSGLVVSAILFAIVLCGCGRARSQKYLNQAKQTLGQGNFSQTLDFCERSLGCDPKNLAALEMEANIYAACGQFDQAMSKWYAIEDADEQQTSRARFKCRITAFKKFLVDKHFRLAAGLQQAGLYQEAMVFCDSVLQVAPFDVRTLAMLEQIRTQWQALVVELAAQQQERDCQIEAARLCDQDAQARLAEETRFREEWGRDYIRWGRPPGIIVRSSSGMTWGQGYINRGRPPAVVIHGSRDWDKPGEVVRGGATIALANRIIQAGDEADDIQDFRQRMVNDPGADDQERCRRQQAFNQNRIDGDRSPEDATPEQMDRTINNLYSSSDQTPSDIERRIRKTQTQPSDMENQIRNSMVKPNSMENEIRNQAQGNH